MQIPNKHHPRAGAAKTRTRRHQRSGLMAIRAPRRPPTRIDHKPRRERVGQIRAVPTNTEHTADQSRVVPTNRKYAADQSLAVPTITEHTADQSRAVPTNREHAAVSDLISERL
ncbi:hypothetical protein J6590_012587 [Homalodisca vitripennis]|nr:hypothetical protein J6590_012587 [Homalodisca vitripennis]